MANRDRRRVVGAFESPEDAEAAASRVTEEGVDPSQVRVGDRRDEATSLQGEMREEAEESFLSPQAGFILTKEMSKGLAVSLPLAVLIGAVVGLPLGFLPIGDVSLVTRLVIAALIGAAGGAVFGFILGAGWSAKGPREPLAAERGTTVAVDDPDPKAVDALADSSPLRVDSAAGGQADDTVATEGDAGQSEIAKGMADQVRRAPGKRSTEGI